MKNNYLYPVLSAVLMIASLACSFGVPRIPELKSGPTETLTLNEPHLDAEVADVSLAMAFGELSLSNGAESLLEGEIRYNVAEWEPTIARTNDSILVMQGEENDFQHGVPSNDLVNVWDIRLGSVPMDLTLSAGAYDATLNLSGVPIRRFTVQDGASQVKIRFDEVNPEPMDRLSYQTGASEIEFTGLANANFAEMNFEGGAGEYIFDFSGDLQRDAAVTIDVGLSNVSILVPEGVSAQVEVEGGSAQVNADGAWKKDGDIYVNAGPGSRLVITVIVDAGEVHLLNIHL